MTLEHVTKRYGSCAALDDLSFELREGEIAAVLGESANVLEQQPDGSFCMREVGLRELAIIDSRKY